MSRRKSVKISKEMAEFTGLDTDHLYWRRDVIKYIYNYIKQNRLYDEKNKRIILCDEKLKKLLNYDQTPHILNRFIMHRYLARHFISKKKNRTKLDTKKYDSESKMDDCPGMLRLRRCLAYMPTTIDQEMKLSFFDMKSSSNSDISATTDCFRKQVYRHPRARQLAAACRYGWMVTPMEAYKPEEFMSRLSCATLRFEERARNTNGNLSG